MNLPPSAEAVVLGASAGAIEALCVILPPLPASFPLAVMVVIHLPADRKSLAADLLQAKCQVRVKEAEDKEPIEAGAVYIAPPGYHLLVEPNRRLSLSGEEPVHFSRPSIDVLFESAADTYGEHLLGIVLTGANSDGARGLRSVRDAGGTVVIQRPDSAYASAMPRAAVEACPGAPTMDLEEISVYLRHIVTTERT
jgi:two-component system, chemotaxis family, protein-glutamate methylesterase/glutaminase